MSNRPSQPARSARQLFRLLDLPRELLVPIIRSFRTPISENSNGVVIYMGEGDRERYRALLDLCVTHRDILPFAQEELFKRLNIRTKQRMNILNRSIASSERCKEYAGRTESIYLGDYVNTENLMDSGAFNPLELCSYSTIKFSTLNRFQNLRRLHLFEAQFDEALVLPNLETYAALYSPMISFKENAAFASVNLPNLRRLVLRHTGAGSFGQLYYSIIPQLDHLTLFWLNETDVEHLLLLSTSLQTLRCRCDRPGEGFSKVIDQISRIGVTELQLHWRLEHENSDNWAADFDSIEKFKGLVAGKDELERVELEFSVKYSQRRSLDRCDQALARWKRIKDELKSICVKNGIEVIALTCRYVQGYTAIWEA